MKTQTPFILFLLFSLLMLWSPSLGHAWGGTWALLRNSIGISAMHMQVLKNNKIIMFDRTDFGLSNISLPKGKCRYNDKVVPVDCTAHSVLYDIASNTIRPLMVQTNFWCSSGSLDPNGSLIQTGGYQEGELIVRTFSPCDDDSCDWVEHKKSLSGRRWYSSNQILPDGRIIIVGGRAAFSYEFYPKNKQNSRAISLPFLRKTKTRGEENNLYPFLHLLPDGNLFIFANNKSILLDYNQNKVVKEFPDLRGPFARNYPCTGSSVLLPLKLDKTTDTGSPEAEVMICGGARRGAFNKSNYEHIYLKAAINCGRLKVTDPKPIWVMETMPMSRVMSDMILLPTGDVILINGASRGTAGWEDATHPVRHPVLYHPDEQDPTSKFVVLNQSKTPRMYHSTAVLLPDGRILVGGSNPHQYYNFTADPFPTDLSLEAFSPDYLDADYADIRPSNATVDSETVSYNSTFSVSFTLNTYQKDKGISVAIITPSFTTHSFSMNQRVLFLNVTSVGQLSTSTYEANVTTPNSVNVGPPGYYMLFVVHAGIPSHAVWVKVQ